MQGFLYLQFVYTILKAYIYSSHLHQYAVFSVYYVIPQKQNATIPALAPCGIYVGITLTAAAAIRAKPVSAVKLSKIISMNSS